MSVTEPLYIITYEQKENQNQESEFDIKFKEHKKRLYSKNNAENKKLSTRIIIFYKILSCLENENLVKYKINRIVKSNNNMGWKVFKEVFNTTLEKKFIEEIITEQKSSHLNGKKKRVQGYFKITHEGRIRLKQLQEILDILEIQVYQKEKEKFVN